MPNLEAVVIGGVDTHKELHWVAAVDERGARLGCKPFPTTKKGYIQMLDFLASFGSISRIGIEGSGSYGAGLCAEAMRRGIDVFEVTAPDKQQRRRDGKSDEIDAYQAAEAAAFNMRCVPAKDRTSDIEALRALKAAYEQLVKQRTAALNCISALVVSAPEELRARLRNLSGEKLVLACNAMRVKNAPGSDLVNMTKLALRDLAKAALAIYEATADLESQIKRVCANTIPKTLDLLGVGPHSASALLLCVGSNITRFKDDAAFAKTCGASPIPVSSGNTSRHRLNRGGDRQANRALHTIAINRIRFDSRSADFVNRKMAEGKSKKDAIRCLKRYIAREVFGALRADLCGSVAIKGDQEKPQIQGV
jgi:transposase